MPTNPFPVDPPFAPEHFARLDPTDDANFYDTPRLVTHIDDTAIAIIGEILADLIPPDATILDLMSSWKSHLPPAPRPRRVVGLGMNATELAANTQLDAWVVHDLNTMPLLPFPDDEFDLAIITVSIQYVTRPITLFQEIWRVLKPGAPLIIFFSNRLFPTKAVRIWTQLDDAGHIALVQSYFQLAGNYTNLRLIDRSPNPNSPPKAGTPPPTTPSTPSSPKNRPPPNNTP
ncbi:MAG: class I SAM-dependent methyltransferase [Thermomicrobiales bacterium]